MSYVSMQNEDYIGYVAHFVSNIDQMTPDDEYRKFFVKTLGTANVASAPEAKVKEMARNLYKAYVAHTLVRYSPFYLVSSLSSKQLSDLVSDQTKLVEKYGLYTAVDVDVSLSNIDKHIKKDSVSTYKSILGKYLPKAAAAKKTTTKKVTTRKPSSVKKTAVASKKPSSIKKTATGKVTATKKTITKKVAPSKTATRAATCKDYTLPELKGMAKGNIKGFSKLNKKELCEALKIKA